MVLAALTRILLSHDLLGFSDLRAALQAAVHRQEFERSWNRESRDTAQAGFTTQNKLI
jgi:hypothetical protein